VANGPCWVWGFDVQVSYVLMLAGMGAWGLVELLRRASAGADGAPRGAGQRFIGAVTVAVGAALLLAGLVGPIAFGLMAAGK
jgi:hypothetical protein